MCLSAIIEIVETTYVIMRGTPEDAPYVIGIMILSLVLAGVFYIMRKKWSKE